MKIYKTKTGQPYIKLKSGRAKFIKRGSKGSVRSNRSTKKSKRSKTMAKRRYKKAKTYRRSSPKGMFGKLNTPLMGAAGVVAYESLLSPMIPLQGVAKDMLELVGGMWLSKKRGFAGATGRSLVTINSYQLVSGLVGNKLQGLIGNVNPTSEYVY